MLKKTTIKQSKIVDQHHEPKIKIKKIHDAQGNIISLEAQFPLVARENESGTWIIFSPHFKTYGYSNKSEHEATENFKISLDIFFKVHNTKGTLEKALLEFGWHKVNSYAYIYLSEHQLINFLKEFEGVWEDDDYVK